MTAPITGAIYVIAAQWWRDSYDGPSSIEEEIDLDHGYFATRDAAQAVADSLDEGPLDRHRAQVAAHEEKVLAWEQKQARAATLGFANPDRRPVLCSEEPLPHIVVEVHPAAKAGQGVAR